MSTPVEPIVIPPDADCRLCGGTGIVSNKHITGVATVNYQCECTMVCQCGEERPNNLTMCASPGCTNQGCDHCDEVEWCCEEHDEANGECRE